MGKDSKAIKTKAKILTFNPTGEYYFSKGVKAYRHRDFYKAKKYIERAMVLEPGEPMIACQLAIILTEMGEYQKSNEQLYRILEDMDVKMAECHYFLANNYAHLGLFKDAYHHANMYLDLEPDGEFLDDAEELLDVLTLEAEELEEDLFEQDELIIKQEKARGLLESGHFNEAIELLNTVIEDFPEYWSAYNNLSLAHFYLGEVEKAINILNDVLIKNPGNLHALCNQLVFAFYLKDFKATKIFKEALKKVNPILFEHQFKLGATFALVGEYEMAYAWLRKLHKHGYEGDGAFYYWLSYSAYFTGRQNLSEVVWKKVIEKSPEKSGLEPWNREDSSANTLEEDINYIRKRFESEYTEERLFALFLTSISSKKQDIISSKWFQINEQSNALENSYWTEIEDFSPSKSSLSNAHETAKELYSFYQPVGTVEAGLFLMWFTIFVELVNEKTDIKNNRAWAAATDYLWHQLREEKISQNQVAKQYGLSTSTLQKYIKMVNKHLI
ncbi:tetratricopeptide repeat protein [Bacillus massilinigeriensis]|uniref:tetratricopeptide repeat protein n=1 Tax=Bacillus massilionigeriensis TaxID=1805475 RepID=UPI00096B67A1|nr:tetratricopeptide repeat protein [Bacillus massilionigeriensis]